MTYRPDPDNLRVHPSRNKALIEQSLREVGGGRSILASGDNTIIAGNATYEQALALGYELIEVETKPNQLVVVKRPDLTGDAARRAAFFDNASGDTSYFDPVLLDAALRETPQIVGGVLTDAELAGIIGQKPIDIGGAGDEFDTTPAEGPTRCQVGDLWEIGPHRLLVGDCTDAANVARLMGGERQKAALCLTDPPYGIAFDGSNRPDEHSRQYDDLLQNDDNDPEALGHFAHSALFAIDLMLRAGGALYLFFPIVRYCIWRAAVESVAEIKAVPMWVKDNPAAGRSDFFWGYEPLFYAIKPGARHTWNGGRGQSDVWQFRNVNSFGYVKDDGTRNAANDAQEHPTQKPLDLIMHAIELSTNRGDLVVDPFAGSGTTLIAAHRHHRRAFLCEIDPKYADIALMRAEAAGLPARRHDSR